MLESVGNLERGAKPNSSSAQNLGFPSVQNGVERSTLSVLIAKPESSHESPPAEHYSPAPFLPLPIPLIQNFYIMLIAEGGLLCHGMWRADDKEAYSFLSPCGFWESNSGYQTWWLVPLCAEPSAWLLS